MAVGERQQPFALELPACNLPVERAVTNQMEQLPIATGFPRLWPLLFPATYLVHIAEEYWCGGGFYNWAKVLGMEISPTRFLAINALAWTIMASVCAIASAIPATRPGMVPFASAVLLNGAAHLLASLLTGTYSPGLFSGLLLWIPLGSYTLGRAHSGMPRRVFWSLSGLGILLHATVTLIAFFGD